MKNKKNMVLIVSAIIIVLIICSLIILIFISSRKEKNIKYSCTISNISTYYKLINIINISQEDNKVFSEKLSKVVYDDKIVYLSDKS